MSSATTRALERGIFRWGICIDDPWTYAGLPAPKSIIIPHLLSVRLPQGPVSMNFGEKPQLRSRRESELLSTVSYFELPEPKKRRQLIRIFSKNLAHQLRKNNVRFVRCWFAWNMFQPRVYPGEDHRRQQQQQEDYRFPLDEFVRILNEEDGIEIVAVLGNGYYRFLPSGLDINNPKTYLARLGEASREIVRHYRGKISMWQLENEPNWWLEHFASDWRRGGIWFEPNIADVILHELSRIASEEDPNTPTMINLEADSSKAFSKLYEKYCDVLGLDFYPNYTRSSPIDVSEIRTKAAEAKRLSGKPVMITETGYPSGPRIFGYGEKNQSTYVKATCEQAYSVDSIDALGMWRLADGYWLSFPFQENYFGLLNFRGMPKPAWFEYMNQTRSRT